MTSLYVKEIPCNDRNSNFEKRKWVRKMSNFLFLMNLIILWCCLASFLSNYARVEGTWEQGRILLYREWLGQYHGTLGVWFSQIFQSSGHESPTEAIGVSSPHVGCQLTCLSRGCAYTYLGDIWHLIFDGFVSSRLLGITLGKQGWWRTHGLLCCTSLHSMYKKE